jgi:hypothetical protein
MDNRNYQAQLEINRAMMILRCSQSTYISLDLFILLAFELWVLCMVGKH